MVIIGRGQLQHHFWGTYHASLGIMFHDAAIAADAQRRAFPKWDISERQPKALIFHGHGDALEAELVNLEAHGADRSKVESVARSIDYGEPFEVEVDLTPAPTETQLTLPAEEL